MGGSNKAMLCLRYTVFDSMQEDTRTSQQTPTKLLFQRISLLACRRQLFVEIMVLMLCTGQNVFGILISVQSNHCFPSKRGFVSQQLSISWRIKTESKDQLKGQNGCVPCSPAILNRLAFFIFPKITELEHQHLVRTGKCLEVELTAHIFHFPHHEVEDFVERAVTESCQI